MESSAVMGHSFSIIGCFVLHKVCKKKKKRKGLFYAVVLLWSSAKEVQRLIVAYFVSGTCTYILCSASNLLFLAAQCYVHLLKLAMRS